MPGTPGGRHFTIGSVDVVEATALDPWVGLLALNLSSPQAVRGSFSRGLPCESTQFGLVALTDLLHPNSGQLRGVSPGIRVPLFRPGCRMSEQER